MTEGALPREKTTPIPSRGFERSLEHNARINMRHPLTRRTAVPLSIAGGTLIARTLCAMFKCPRSETSSL
jgi:hypothetical protein